MDDLWSLDGTIDLDKAWQGIHFLLCGDVWGGDGPEAFLMSGGTTLAALDMGMGPARLLPADRVAAAAAALAAIEPDALIARIDPEAIAAAEIYPLHGEPPDPDFAEYVRASYEMLRELVAATAEAGLALVTWIS